MCVCAYGPVCVGWYKYAGSATVGGTGGGGAKVYELQCHKQSVPTKAPSPPPCPWPPCVTAGRHCEFKKFASELPVAWRQSMRRCGQQAYICARVALINQNKTKNQKPNRRNSSSSTHTHTHTHTHTQTNTWPHETQDGPRQACLGVTHGTERGRKTLSTDRGGGVYPGWGGRGQGSTCGASP